MRAVHRLEDAEASEDALVQRKAVPDVPGGEYEQDEPAGRLVHILAQRPGGAQHGRSNREQVPGVLRALGGRHPGTHCQSLRGLQREHGAFSKTPQTEPPMGHPEQVVRDRGKQAPAEGPEPGNLWSDTAFKYIEGGER